MAAERLFGAPLGGLLAQTSRGFWMPEAGSTLARYVDGLFFFILCVSALFFALIVVLMTVFVVRYRHRPGDAAEKTASHNTWLEAAWSFIPLVIVIVIFAWGFLGYMEMRVAPRDAYEIEVVAKKWQWLFKYANGHVDEQLHVPVDRPVRLVMRSEDVIHSLYVPAFRVKMDVVPGRFTTTWFEAIAPGTYPLLCAEYCGAGPTRGHSDMITSVVVHEPGRFESWLDEAGNWMKNLAPAEAGEQLFHRRGCAQCHSVDGRALVGPTLLGVWGQTHRFTDGSSAEVDENYVRQSILEPMAKMREGYSAQMPTYKGILNDEEISALIAYIRSLK